MKKIGENFKEWRTSSGKTIPLEEMATTHIINSLNKIKSSNNEWRKEWIPYLEAELARRNMYVASPQRDSWMINEKEMAYFLETSCDFQIVRGEDEIFPVYSGVTNDAIELYLKGNFAIPVEDNKEEFIREIILDVSKISANDFYKKYEYTKIENVFENAWKRFIDLMLGRLGNEETV